MTIFLIPKAAFKYWISVKDQLFEKKHIPGFILLEKDDDGIEYALGYDQKICKEKLKLVIQNFM